MTKKYTVNLSDEERRYLRDLTTKGQPKARRLRRARTLLLADEGRTDAFISEALGCGHAPVERTRQRCVEEGLEAALLDKPQPAAAPKLSGKEEALLVALACSDAPEGRSRWTIRLLVDKMAELTEHTTVSRELVRRSLKKRNEALAKQAVVHRRSRCRLRLRHGRRARPLRGASARRVLR